jgi:hypothetical protein
MWSYILLFLLFLSSGIIIGIFISFKEEFVKKKWHLIIPIIFIAFWGIYYQLTFGRFWYGGTGDFHAFWEGGRYVLIDPTKLYYYQRTIYKYLPSFAMSFSITISLFPFRIAYMIFYVIIFLSGVISIFEFNKILKLMDVKKQIHRFMFLIIISNGYFIYMQFAFSSFKYFIFIIFLFIIRREMQYRKEGKEKDLKYYIINYALLIYAIGVAPYFIFLVFIYLFHDIRFRELMEKVNIQKYCIFLVLFILENFLFVLYPSLIFDFLKSFYHPSKGSNLLRMLYIEGMFEETESQVVILIYIFNSILSALTIFLIFYKKLKIEEKFSFFLLAYLFFGLYSFQFTLALVLFGFILLLFVPFLNQDVKGFEFIKRNIILLTGLLSIGIMFFIAHNFIFYQFFPIYNEVENDFIRKTKMLFLHIIMMICIVTLYLQRYRTTKIQKEQSFRILSTKEIT